MRSYTFEVVIEPDDGGYSAYVPALPGCFSNGATLDDARRNVRDAIQQHIQVLKAHGQPLPVPGRIVVEELTVSIPE